jgi:quercetin dioxygenase-like cupin family protein
MTTFKTKVVGSVFAILALGMLGAACDTVAEGEDEPGLGEEYTAPTGLTLQVLARGNLIPTPATVEIKSEGLDSEYEVKNGNTMDFVFVKITLAPGGQTGWHYHPGPANFSVAAGAVDLYHAEAPCTIHDNVATGDALMEHPGHIERAFNHGTTDAVVYGNFVTPPGGAFRIDAPAPAGSELCPNG